MTSSFANRSIGRSDISVSPVAMGCWPIAGMTSINVNDGDSQQTLHAALDAGINFFDTAFCYGAEGESEKHLAQAVGARSDVVVATKGGIHWNPAGQRVQDGRPATLLRECQESLRRLGRDSVELYYLHAPDPEVPIEESAGAIRQMIDSGLVQTAGLSNGTLEQIKAFQSACPLSAIQPPFNMLQREIEHDIVPYCEANSISVFVYWPLMKGLLAGKLPRNHKFPPNDGRAKYPMFQGEEWERNQDFLDELRAIAQRVGKTVAQVVVNWTIHQSGITGALCGAKRAYQIAETAGAMGWQLSSEDLAIIQSAIERRGVPITKSAV